MKVRAYLRIGVMKRGSKLSATNKPSHAPLFDANGSGIPTVAFAVDFNIPDELFKQAQIAIAEINVTKKGAKICAEIQVPQEK